ncbi:transposase [Priestia megaterium]|uniref:RNA-guided endonuclease InsQ/TnpB family protein n=1 Tax=Priestia megaterium TaxID=1404 RepID=UPI000BFDCACD|nr:RNA-guided endonuclease TnpB family protein [Priestia megaterium]PGR28510.1 transposase [Priestia megaterium]
MIIARKIRLTVISDNRDEAYSFLRNEMYYYYKALNFAMNHVYFNYVAKEKIKMADDKYIEREQRYINAINNTHATLKKVRTESQKDLALKRIELNEQNLKKLRQSTSKEAREMLSQAISSAERTNTSDAVQKAFPMLTRDSIDFAASKATTEFNNDLKLGLLSGERVLRTYKKTNPLQIRGRLLKFFKEDGDYCIKFAKGIIFKCVLGIKRKNNTELAHTLEKVIDGTYKVCDSSFEYNDSKLILNLALQIDITARQQQPKVQGRVVGVDLGLKIPAFCALNDSIYIRERIGDIEDFLKVRTQLQARRKRLQRALKSAKGGKGQGKKLKALERFREHEKNFVKTYNHYLSKKIVHFSVLYGAEQINLELLQMAESQNKSILRNWSYYQLQQMIEYKAAKEGIKIKYVDPYRTSQTCSKCGNYENGQRKTQATFECKSCKFKENADFNAARNIAKSTAYITDKFQSEYYKNYMDCKLGARASGFH